MNFYPQNETVNILFLWPSKFHFDNFKYLFNPQKDLGLSKQLQLIHISPDMLSSNLLTQLAEFADKHVLNESFHDYFNDILDELENYQSKELEFQQKIEKITSQYKQIENFRTQILQQCIQLPQNNLCGSINIFFRICFNDQSQKSQSFDHAEKFKTDYQHIEKIFSKTPIQVLIQSASKANKGILFQAQFLNLKGETFGIPLKKRSEYFEIFAQSLLNMTQFISQSKNGDQNYLKTIRQIMQKEIKDLLSEIYQQYLQVAESVQIQIQDLNWDWQNISMVKNDQNQLNVLSLFKIIKQNNCLNEEENKNFLVWWLNGQSHSINIGKLSIFQEYFEQADLLQKQIQKVDRENQKLRKVQKSAKTHKIQIKVGKEIEEIDNSNVQSVFQIFQQIGIDSFENQNFSELKDKKCDNQQQTVFIVSLNIQKPRFMHFYDFTLSKIQINNNKNLMRYLNRQMLTQILLLQTKSSHTIYLQQIYVKAFLQQYGKIQSYIYGFGGLLKYKLYFSTTNTMKWIAFKIQSLANQVLQKQDFNFNLKIKTVWEKEERNCSDQEGGILKIIGITIYNRKNIYHVTENPVQFEFKLNVGSTIYDIFSVPQPSDFFQNQEQSRQKIHQIQQNGKQLLSSEFIEQHNLKYMDPWCSKSLLTQLVEKGIEFYFQTKIPSSSQNVFRNFDLTGNESLFNIFIKFVRNCNFFSSDIKSKINIEDFQDYTNSNSSISALLLHISEILSQNYLEPFEQLRKLQLKMKALILKSHKYKLIFEKVCEIEKQVELFQIILEMSRFVDGWAEMEALSDVGINVFKVKMESPHGLNYLLILLNIYFFYQHVESNIDSIYESIESFQSVLQDFQESQQINS